MGTRARRITRVAIAICLVAVGLGLGPLGLPIRADESASTGSPEDGSADAASDVAPVAASGTSTPEIGTAAQPMDAAAPAAASGSTGSPLCGPEDDPAVGCGIRVVGSNDLGRTNSFNLAKVGNCAYVSSSATTSIVSKTPSLNETDGVGVIDVRDPSRPRLATILRTPGSTESSETIHAVDAGKRKVLVVGAYGGKTSGHPLEDQIGTALDVYDVSGDCANPRLMSTVYWPDNVHNVTLNPSGTRVYGTRFAPNPGPQTAMTLSDTPVLADTPAFSDTVPLGSVASASPVPLMNVMVMDIKDMAKPRLAADVPLVLPDGTKSLCHTVHFDKSETRMYCAGRLSDRAQPDGREPAHSVWRWAGPSIWDVSEIAQGKSNPEVRFVGESAIKGQGGHHAVPAKINGRRYIVAANELAFTCDMAAYPRIWDITDEKRPRVVSELHLPAPDECAGNHYNNVDSYENTKMALVGWMEAGLRVFDLRNPAQPRQVAYFKPGSSCKSYVYLHEPTGHLWFACDDGFYVVALAPHVRSYMGLPKGASSPTALTTQAWVARAPTTANSAQSRADVAAAALYCALPLATAALSEDGR